MGLCEPHGPIAAFGLDTIKAEFICEAAARKVGGIVAPTQGYHIHETGYHAPWLEEVVGEVNPRMASLPPEILLSLFLYQLRAFSNAGFKAAVVITGHSGGNQEDLRMVAAAFMDQFPLKVEVRADPELVAGRYEGDHAGKYEISQLMHIRPDLVDMARISRPQEDTLLGRFALGPDAAEASPELGREIMEACIEEACQIAENLQEKIISQDPGPPIDFAQTEKVWEQIAARRKSWFSYSLHPGQQPASAGSRWKKYEIPS
jgi:creatinine amidohydrolase